MKVRMNQVQVRHYLSEAYHIALEVRKWSLILLRVAVGKNSERFWQNSTLLQEFPNSSEHWEQAVLL